MASKGRRRSSGSIFAALVLAFCTFALFSAVMRGSEGEDVGPSLMIGCVNGWAGGPGAPGVGCGGASPGGDGAFDSSVTLSDIKAAKHPWRLNAIVSLDRPIYLPGEVLRGAVTFIHAVDNRASQPPPQAQIQILNQRGAVIHSTYMYPTPEDKFSLGFAWPIPASSMGGEFTVRFESQSIPGQEIPITERGFEIHAARQSPKILAGIELEKEDAFEVGDKVLFRVVGHELEIAQVSISLSMNGQVVLAMPGLAYKSDAFSLTLPAPSTPVSDATLSVVIARSGISETISKTIVIKVPGVVELQAMPETGEVVCGVGPTFVYLQATHVQTGRPLDFEGAQIVTEDGTVLVDGIKSLHKGRSKAAVPVSLKPLLVKLDNSQFAVPWRCSKTPSLNADFTITSMNPLSLTVRGRGSKYRVGVFRKEVELWKSPLSKPGVVDVPVCIEYGKCEGVLRVTLYDEAGTPVAERLVFHAPQKTLQVALRACLPEEDNRCSSDVLEASPNDLVQVEVTTLLVDSKGRTEPFPASVLLRTSDASLASSMDTDRLAPRLAAAHWLEAEVSSMVGWEGLGWGQWGWRPNSEALKSDYARNMDLILGVQGWRRFVYANLTRPDGLEPEARRRRHRLVGCRPLAPPPPPQVMFAAANMHVLGNKAMMRGAAMPVAVPMMAEAMQAEDAAWVANDAVAVGGGDIAMAAPLDADVGAAMEEANVAEPMAKQAADVMPMGLQNNPMAPMPPRHDVMQHKRAYQRIYAHPQRRFSKKEFEHGPVRSDFTPTLYFNPEVITKCDRVRCSAKVSFALNDASSSRFVVHADGIALDGSALGPGAHLAIKTLLPLEVDVRLPPVLTQGDVAVLPVTVQRGSGSMRVQATLDGGVFRNTEIASEGGGIRLNLPFDTAKLGLGAHNISMKVSDAKNKDTVTRTTALFPRGFPMAFDSGGVLKLGQRTVIPVKLPALAMNVRPRLLLYTNPVGRLTSAIAALVREPCGCFEQTSSTTFPLVFALQYLKLHPKDAGGLLGTATDMLKRGLAKLLSFETPTGGFEWFGQSPGHEALTAYGLLQFHAIAKTLPGAVSEGLNARVAKWILSRRDGRGGFLRNTKQLDSFGMASPATTDAYITWTLVEAEQLKSESVEFQTLSRAGLESKDPYIAALAALAHIRAGNKDAAGVLAKRLVAMQGEDGAVRASDSITMSRGEALLVEGTALSALVFTKLSTNFADHARRAIDYIAARCKNGRFASTQATALSLMAIVEFEIVFPATMKRAVIKTYVDGRVTSTAVVGAPLGSSKAIVTAQPCEEGLVWNECGSACSPTCTDHDGPCTMQCVARCECPRDRPLLDEADGRCKPASECSGSPDAEGIVKMCTEALQRALTSEKRAAEVELEIVGDGAQPLPFSLRVDYSVLTPDTAEASPLALATSLPADAAEGDVLSLEVTVSTKATANMVVAVIGVPAGLQVRMAKLTDLKERKIIDFFEVSSDGDVVVYWRGLAAGKQLRFLIEATALVPGNFEGKASRIYEFYHDEAKTWTKGVTVRVEARQGLKWPQN